MVGRIVVVHGPNLNLLGTREQQLYGRTTLADINQQLQHEAAQVGHDLTCFQSNHEGELVDWIQQQGPTTDVLIINPAAYTHTSVALRDAILGVAVPAIEVHLSNIHRRESFRRHSYFSDITVGQVVGFGAHGYILAFHAACHLLRQSDVQASSP